MFSFFVPDGEISRVVISYYTSVVCSGVEFSKRIYCASTYYWLWTVTYPEERQRRNETPLPRLSMKCIFITFWNGTFFSFFFFFSPVSQVKW